MSKDARALARSTIAWLEVRGIPPTPEHYRVAFAHLSGEEPALSAAVGELEREGSGPDAIQLRALYERFFEGPDARALSEHGRRLAELAGRLQRELAEAGEETRRYGDTLSSVRAAVARPDDLARVVELLGRIADETERMHELATRLEGGLASGAAEIRELRRSLQAAQEAALTDPLTGLANRKRFDLALAGLAAEAAAERRPMTLIMADIDHFKDFNDRHGHRMGDLVLKLVADLLRDHFKGRDLVARYGGEEFAVILDDTPLPTGFKLAEQLRETLATRHLRTRDKTTIGRITLSLGLAELQPGEPIGRWVERADRALYAAKRAGRNRSVALAACEP
ncbi:MAG: GGDEF domain-containing protein [Geminicoccaceae bacterium]|nr:MAG: GGDEF domain-containing protein [Geminicoccaceae bacterium]